ncbi:MAG: hypothetical protein ACJASZ_002994 [Yoonia sp.]|jgi:hypothetical protein
MKASRAVKMGPQSRIFNAVTPILPANPFNVATSEWNLSENSPVQEFTI